MKKYAISLLIPLAITLIPTGCAHTTDIGKDKATDIALNDANLTEKDVSRLRVSKDRDDGESIYEVQFTSQNTEYEYEILASDGEILSADYDESYTQNPASQRQADSGQDANTPPADNPQTDSGKNQNSSISAKITLEEASALALERVPGASAQDLKIELEYDDGRSKYEGDIIYEQKEYEFEIDADTGNFLKWEEERR